MLQKYLLNKQHYYTILFIPYPILFSFQPGCLFYFCYYPILHIYLPYFVVQYVIYEKYNTNYYIFKR